MPLPCAGSITGPTTVQVPNRVTLVWSHTSGEGTPSVYAWSESSDAISISGSATGSSVSIRGDNAGTGTVSITVSCTNGETATDTHSVTVTAPATPCAGSITGATEVRQGSSIELRWTHTQGQGTASTYQWSESSTAISFLGSTRQYISAVQGDVAGQSGVVSIAVTCTNGGTASDTHTVTVTAIPATPCAGRITGATEVQRGSSIELRWTHTQGQGTPSIYRWSESSTAISFLGSTRQYISAVRGDNAGSGTVSITVTCSNGGRATDTHTVTVVAAPMPCVGLVSGPIAVAVGESITLTWTHTQGQGSPSTYSWTVPNGLSGSSTSSTITLQGVTEGNWRVNAEIGCTNGGTATSGKVVTVTAAVPSPCSGTITGDMAVRVGATITLTWSHTSGQGTPSVYAWTESSAAISISGSSTGSSVTIRGESIGTGTVNVTVACTDGGTIRVSYDVMVASVATPCVGSISGPSAVAVGGTIRLNWSHSVGLGQASGYSWSESSDAISINGSATGSSVVIRGDSTGSGTVSIAVTCTNGGTASDTFTVTVMVQPCAGTITGPSSVVDGSTITLRWSHDSGEGTASTYLWSGDSNDFGFSSSVTGSFIWVTGQNVGSGTVSITVTCTNGGRATDTHTVTVTAIPATPCAGFIRGGNTVQQGGGRSLAWSHTQGQGTPSTYSWTESSAALSIDGSSTSASVVIHGESLGSGVVTINVTCTNGGTATDTHTVTVTAIPAMPCAGSISGGSSVQDGSTISLSWSHTSGQGSPSAYSWSESSAAISISGSATGSSVTIRGDNAGSGTVSIAVTCTNGGTASDTHTITVTVIPVTPCAGSISGGITVQDGSTISLSWSHTSGQGRASFYSWSESSAAISISGSATGSSVTIRGENAGSGTVSITVTCTNGGTASDTHTIVVTSIPDPVRPCAGSISGGSSVRDGSTISLSWSHSEGSPSSYVWSESSAAISIRGSATGSSVTIRGENVGSGTVTINVICTNGGTASDAHTVTVTAIPATPCAGFIRGGNTVQQGGGRSLAWSHTQGQGTPSTYSWTESSAALSIDGSSTSASVVIHGERQGSGIVTIVVTCTNGGTATDSRTITVIAAPTPCAGAISGGISVQAGSTISLSWSHTQGQGSPSAYSWSESSAAISISGSATGSSATIRGENAGSGTVSITVTCTNNGTATDSHTVTVTAAPMPCAGRITGVTEIQVQNRGTLTWTHTLGQGDPRSYTWTVPSGLIGGSSSGQISVYAVTSGTYEVGISVRCTNGGTATDTHTVTVPALPCSGRIVGPTSVQAGNAVTLQWASIGTTGASTYSWSETSAALSIVGRTTGFSATVRGVQAGSGTVTAQIVCTGGGTASDTHTITVTAAPVRNVCYGDISGPLRLELGARGTYRWAYFPNEGTPSTYAWTAETDNIAIRGSSTGSSISVEGLTPGRAQLTIRVQCTNGANALEFYFFIVGPPCIGAIAGPSTVTFTSRTHTLTWEQTEGTAVSWTWTLTGSITGSSDTGEIEIALNTPWTGGLVEVNVTCSNGGVAFDRVGFRIGCIASIDGPAELNAGATGTYRDENLVGNNVRWLWQVTGVSVDRSSDQSAHLRQQVSVTAPAMFTSGTLTLHVWTDAAGQSCASATVTIMPPPAPCAGSISGAGTLSRGRTIALDWEHTTGQGVASTYHWSITGGGWSITGGATARQMTVTASNSFNGGVVSISVTCTNGGMTTDTHTVTKDEDQDDPCGGSINGPVRLGRNAQGTYRWNHTDGTAVLWRWTHTGALSGTSTTPVLTVTTGSAFSGGTISITVTCSDGNQARDTVQVGLTDIPPAPTGLRCVATATLITAVWTQMPDATFAGDALGSFEGTLTHPSGATTVSSTNRFGSLFRWRGAFVPNQDYTVTLVAIYGENNRSHPATTTCRYELDPSPALQKVAWATLTPNLSGYKGVMGDVVVVTVEAERPLFAVAKGRTDREILQLNDACDGEAESVVSLLTGDTMNVIFCAPGEAAISLYDAWTGLLMQDYWPVTVSPTGTE